MCVCRFVGFLRREGAWENSSMCFKHLHAPPPYPHHHTTTPPHYHTTTHNTKHTLSTHTLHTQITLPPTPPRSQFQLLKTNRSVRRFSCKYSSCVCVWLCVVVCDTWVVLERLFEPRQGDKPLTDELAGPVHTGPTTQTQNMPKQTSSAFSLTMLTLPSFPGPF